jgi:Fe2+ or Zn2+ uptake regulation protein
MTDFAQLLRSQGKRVTPARIAVLELLQQEKRPLSVEMIIHGLGEGVMDYVTIYRTLTLLKSLGLIRQIDFQHNHAHFELAALGDHHHVVCVKCSKVADVMHCNMKRMQQAALQESGFRTITEHALEFFGVCKQCATV